MLDRPRYSITPAGACTDERLEGRDLQVLCYLGMHTDKMGWCFLRQAEIAEPLRTSRATVQRSLARLIDAGYVQTRKFDGARPHACHAYRVIMDRDEPDLDPPEYAVGGSEQGERCPPVSTSGEVPHRRAPVPSLGRAPPANEVPTYTWAHNDQDSGGGGSGGSARAREPAISQEAFALSREIGAIAGHDPEFLPPAWVSNIARVQMMLDHGWSPAMMRDTARAVMQHKRDGPPETIRYFEKPFARAHAERTNPAPLPALVEHPATERQHVAKAQPSQDWQRSRDRFRGALGRLGAAIDDAAPTGGGKPGEEAFQPPSSAGRGRS